MRGPDLPNGCASKSAPLPPAAAFLSALRVVQLPISAASLSLQWSAAAQSRSRRTCPAVRPPRTGPQQAGRVAPRWPRARLSAHRRDFRSWPAPAQRQPLRRRLAPGVHAASAGRRQALRAGCRLPSLECRFWSGGAISRVWRARLRRWAAPTPAMATVVCVAPAPCEDWAGPPTTGFELGEGPSAFCGRPPRATPA
jgi:hypothetical protein